MVAITGRRTHGVEAAGRVDGTEHLLGRRAAVVEVEREALAVAEQPVAHGVQPDLVDLEPVAEAGLGDPPAGPRALG